MDRKGIRPGKKENKLGMRVSDTAELVLEDCRVPDANVLGEIGYGFIDAMKVLDGGRISIGALAVGIARGAYEAARDYSKQRTAFGKPISEFQAIQFMLADMATEIDAARLLCHRAATIKDAGEKRHAVLGDGQAVRVRGGGARDGEGRADLRRLRLHQGVPGREVLPRREALHDRRRTSEIQRVGRDRRGRSRCSACVIARNAARGRQLCRAVRAMKRPVLLHLLPTASLHTAHPHA